MQRQNLRIDPAIINKFNTSPETLTINELNAVKSVLNEQVKELTQGVRDGQNIWIQDFVSRTTPPKTALANLELFAKNPEAYCSPIQDMYDRLAPIMSNDLMTPDRRKELTMSEPRQFLRNYAKLQNMLSNTTLTIESIDLLINAKIQTQTSSAAAIAPVQAAPAPIAPAANVSEQGVFKRSQAPQSAASVDRKCNVM